MEEKDLTKSIFLYGYKFVRVNPREEKNIKQLIEKYESVERVPAGEIVSVCYTERKKDKFIDDENYFYIPVIGLKPADDELMKKRRNAFLNFGFRKVKN